MIEVIRFICGNALILVGLFIIAASVFGNYKFHYVLNRMHAAAMQDTLGILFMLVGLMFFSGFSFTTMKLFFVILFFWFSSPACSHLLVRMEVTTNEKIEEEVEVIEE